MDSLINSHPYLDQPAQWSELVARARRAGIVGLDTEFYGVNVRRESCVGKARIHVWSVALRTKKADPAGFHKARGWVLPAAALEYPEIVELLQDQKVTKCVHNLPVDSHALDNHGVKLVGAVNTLNLARWAWPELVNDGFFGLKNLMVQKLRRAPVCEFADVVTYQETVTVERRRVKSVSVCDCGTSGCRLRKGHAKTKSKIVAITDESINRKAEYPLQTILPGHERWDLLVKYAAEDAVAALELEELSKRSNPAPWPYGGERPDFDHRIDAAIVEMEATGVRIDTEWAEKQSAVAESDEGKTLGWLSKWHLANRGSEPTPKLWNSHKQLVELFDEFEFPRSPIWKKGRVKPGQPAKLDSTALDWIAAAHPPARGVISKLLLLKKIRSGKKYLAKLAASGGVVHPICGPAGDSDDRNGAVTGRLGIKGAIELQQLPKDKTKDLYQIRRGVVAAPGNCLLVADYTALEVVIMADLAMRLFDDCQLADSLRPGAPDFHSGNTRRVFGELLGWVIPATFLGVPCDRAGERVDVIPTDGIKKHPYTGHLRDLSKAVLYGVFYGKRGYGFATLPDGTGGMIGEQRATEIVNALLDAIPALRKFEQWTESFIRRHSGVYSLDGRWCDLSLEMAGDEWLQRRAIRRALNYPMQASGAGIIGDAMARVAACPVLASTGYKLVLQVHDELVMEGPAENVAEAGEILRQHMTSATANGIALLVPLQVTVGHGTDYLSAK